MKVTEQSTGELSLGAGYSSTSSFVGEFAYTERNLFGRGQYLRASIQMSHDQQAIPVQLHRALVPRSSAGGGLRPLQIVTDYHQAAYQGDATAAASALRLSDVRIRQHRPELHLQDQQGHAVHVPAPLEVQLAAGYDHRPPSSATRSCYNTLDDVIKPTKRYGLLASRQDFAGFGGNAEIPEDGRVHRDLPPNCSGIRLSVRSRCPPATSPAMAADHSDPGTLSSRAATAFRGFKLAGIGPRDMDVTRRYGRRGRRFLRHRQRKMRLPDFLPADYGMKFCAVLDFGTLGHLDTPVPPCSCRAASRIIWRCAPRPVSRRLEIAFRPDYD